MCEDEIRSGSRSEMTYRMRTRLSFKSKLAMDSFFRPMVTDDEDRERLGLVDLEVIEEEEDEIRG